ncbi:MAG: hypothetical protein HOD92_21960, partial [Deltaproteobacteria bacterium]|nr:hypothetical protein [Deltaproteobacteria bacterium]
MNPIHNTAHLRRLFFFKILILLGIVLAETSLATVNYDGSFSYSIPIEVPAGINGVQPNLSLEYNSEDPNGLLGQGWKLYGIPAISRIKFNKVVKYSVSVDDTYSGPDGRLIKLPNGEYRGENSPFNQYIPSYCGNPDNSPCSWEMHDQSGNTWKFGTSTNSKIKALNVNAPNDPIGVDIFRTYALEEMKDPFGNKWTVTYAKDEINGEYYPNNISYNGSSIIFYYENRLDTYEKYDQNAYIKQTKRLNYIIIKYDDNEIKKYDIRYETDVAKKPSTIEYIEQVATDDNIIFRLANFEWIDKNTSDLDPPKISPCNEGKPCTISSYTDINNDGIKDKWTLSSNRTNLKVINNNSNQLVLNRTISSIANVGTSYYYGYCSNNCYTVLPYMVKAQRYMGYSSADFNGDSKSDLIYTNAGRFTYSYKAFFKKNSWNSSPNRGPDRCTRDNGQKRGINPNTVSGKSFSTYISFSDGNTFTKSALINTVPANKLGNYKFFDYNSDGKSDILIGSNVYLSKGRNSFTGAIPITDFPDPDKQFKIKTVTNQNGGKIRVAYQATKNFAGAIITDTNATCGGVNETGHVGNGKKCGNAYDSSKFLVENIIKENGHGTAGWDVGDTYHSRKYTYEYKNGRDYPGIPTKKKDLGFETFIENEFVNDTQQISKREVSFNQDGDKIYAGSPIKITDYVYEGTTEQKIKEEILVYKDAQVPADLDFVHPVDSNNTQIKQVLLASKTTQTYLNGDPVFKYNQVNTYGDFGRITKVESINGNGTNLDENTKITSESGFYEWAIGDNWSAMLPTSIKVTKEGDSVIKEDIFSFQPGHNTVELKSHTKTYACEDTSTCGTGTTRTIRQNINYTAQGLIDYEQDAEGVITAYNYDLSSNQLISKTVDHLKEIYGYDENGRLNFKSIPIASTESTTTIGTVYTYDKFGRISTVTNPNGGTVTYDYEITGLPNTQYKSITTTQKVKSDGTTNTITKREYFDGFGFVYQTVTYPGDQNATIPADKTIYVDHSESWVNGERSFTSSYPYKSSDPKKEITTTYRPDGRKKLTTRPDSSGKEYAYDINASNNFCTTLTEGKVTGGTIPTGLDTKTCVNAKGLLVEKIDKNGKAIKYQYNDANQVNRVELPEADIGVDPLITNVYYDSLGRKTKLNDPSTGVSKYYYDGRGNLEEVIDSKDRETIYTYDDLNRITKKEVKDGATTTTIAEYVYDKDFTLSGGEQVSNTMGKLSRVKYGNNDTYFNYDNNGQLIQKHHQLEGLNINGSPLIFTETITSNEFGTPLEYTFPDGTTQNIDYNDNGFIDQIGLNEPGENHPLPIAVYSEYNAANQIGKKELGNNITTDYTYTPTGRLSNLTTTNNIGTQIQNLSYTFEENRPTLLQQITDGRTNKIKSGVIDGVDNQDINTDETQKFTYDNLGRLTSATWLKGSAGNEVSDGSYHYTFDNIGNLKTRTEKKADNTVIDFFKLSYQDQQAVEGWDSETENADSKIFNGVYDTVGNLSHKIFTKRNQNSWAIIASDPMISIPIKVDKTASIEYKYDGENRLTEVWINGRKVTKNVYSDGEQRLRKIYYRSNGTTVSTWYIGGTFEVRYDNNLYKATDAAAGWSSTKFIQAPGQGKIASITRVFNRETYNNNLLAIPIFGFNNTSLRDLLGIRSLEGLTKQLPTPILYDEFRLKGDFINITGLVLLIGGSLLLLWLVFTNKGKQGNFDSRFNTWQRVFAISIVLMFVISACRSGDSGSQQEVELDDLADIIYTDGPNYDLVGDT